jgi:hypothetical protein
VVAFISQQRASLQLLQCRQPAAHRRHHAHHNTAIEPWLAAGQHLGDHDAMPEMALQAGGDLNEDLFAVTDHHHLLATIERTPGQLRQNDGLTGASGRHQARPAAFQHGALTFAGQLQLIWAKLEHALTAAMRKR